MSEPTDHTEPIDEPMTAPETETMPEPIAEPIAEPMTEPIAEPVIGSYQPPTTPPLLATAGEGPQVTGQRLGPSVPTVLWGLFLAAVATFAIVHQVSDVDLDLAVAVPVALLAIGGALVVWGVTGLARKRR